MTLAQLCNNTKLPYSAIMVAPLCNKVAHFCILVQVCSKDFPLCNNLIHYCLFQQVQYSLRISLLLNGFVLHCQTLKALSSKFTLAKITSFPW